MVNKKIRLALSEYEIPQWKLAKIMNISESSVYRLLREELPEERQDEIVRLIREEK